MLLNKIITTFARNILKETNMETLNISLDKRVADIAYSYAKERGESLSSIVEAYLKQVAEDINAKKAHESRVPDVVMSLLGAGAPIADDDLNGRKAYAEYINEKHR